MKYVIAIDQSTQGTKAILFDERLNIVKKSYLAHRQIVNNQGWVSHDMEEVYQNLLSLVKELLCDGEIIGVGISNQRETTVCWDETGKPLANAVVWQCARAESLCKQKENHGEEVKNISGLKLSPYFPASKMEWLIKNKITNPAEAYFGTVDSFLIYRLTGEYKTDYSNASRTQLFDIHSLKWSERLKEIFGLKNVNLPEICASDRVFGYTDFDGILNKKIPVCGVLGDSHAALYAQSCVNVGDVKATYGTGSSVMMNTGDKCVDSKCGLATSLAWKIRGKVNYVLEGNINYTGASISWLVDTAKLISSPSETEELCKAAIKDDSLYFIPAFTGLGAPYWNSDCRGGLLGINRTTGKSEITRAVVESIAYQIADIVFAMERDISLTVPSLRVDGGPTKNKYLMQFQSDILQKKVQPSSIEEMSAYGVAKLCAESLGVSPQTPPVTYSYKPELKIETAELKYSGWKQTINKIIG